MARFWPAGEKKQPLNCSVQGTFSKPPAPKFFFQKSWYQDAGDVKGHRTLFWDGPHQKPGWTTVLPDVLNLNSGTVVRVRSVNVTAGEVMDEQIYRAEKDKSGAGRGLLQQ